MKIIQTKTVGFMKCCVANSTCRMFITVIKSNLIYWFVGNFLRSVKRIQGNVICFALWKSSILTKVIENLPIS